MSSLPDQDDQDGQDGENDTALQNAITDLQNASQIPSRQRSIKTGPTVAKFSSLAYERGLPTPLLDAVVDLVTQPSALDQASVTALIRSLYPRQTVQPHALLKVLGALGHGEAKAAYRAQAALVAWVVAVWDVVGAEGRALVGRAYALLFNLLDTLAVRAPLCHLLSLITRRKHVRPFRIQMLLELARRVGNEPPLVGLIRVYKDYYPDVIVGEATAGRASVFTNSDPEWRERLFAIQEAHALKSQNGLAQQQHSFKVVRRGINGVKRSKVYPVPEVHTSRAQEASVTLEEIESPESLIDNLEKIELPNQLVAVLGDPLLQKLLQLKSTEATMARVDNWLLAFFDDQLADPNQSDRALLDMLTTIRDYTRFSKVLPPSCISYLKSMLSTWNGVTGREVILDLVASIPLSPFDELLLIFFQPLETAILDDTPESQIAILNVYTSLLRNWTCDLLCFPSPGPPPFTGSTIGALITHANLLALTILQTSESTSAHGPILTFYEATAALFSHAKLQQCVRITAPHSALVYQLHFSPCLSTLSRLCGVLALYKRAFEAAMSAKPSISTPTTADGMPPPPPPEPYPKDYVNHFNGFLMDICNCLWRGRAFNTSDLNALGCLLPPKVLPVLSSYVASLDTGLALGTLFTLSYSPLLCRTSINFLREVEEKRMLAADAAGVTRGSELKARHAGPVTQKSLALLGRNGGVNMSWAEYRLGVLKYLEERGVRGVGELMYNTMKHLMSARDGAAGKK